MNLQLANHTFIVCGASSGFGLAVTRGLCREKANVIGVGRNSEPLEKLQTEYGSQFIPVAGNLTEEQTQDRILESIGENTLNGVVLNAGGPPPKPAAETDSNDWNQAYQTVFLWKTQLVRKLLPLFRDQQYGRILFIESQSTKQPIPDLVLSNAMRAAIVGYAKTLSREVGPDGITVNVLAPGSHDTPAIERIIKNKSTKLNVSPEQARETMESNIPVRRFGKAEELASLATWLLSPESAYLTGQTISHDGGNIQGLFG